MSSEIIRYKIPENWIAYDKSAVLGELSFALGSIIAMANVPYQRSWADKLQEIQLKREIGGTTRIEGAEFNDDELQVALSESASDAFTRSQKQAFAAKKAYKLIAEIPSSMPITEELIKSIHSNVVAGADDDHCAPGEYRKHNVTFGIPIHRGAVCGEECEQAMKGLVHAVNNEFREHHFIIQALALHYHLGAIHPFSDGNGRTARALEAMLLGRAGLKNLLFIAMSNFYHDEKQSYLEAMNQSGLDDHDLTRFLKFGLAGVAKQCEKLLKEMRIQLSKSLFRDVMHQLYRRTNKRKRVIIGRQIEILNVLLDVHTEEIEYGDLYRLVLPFYQTLKNSEGAFFRDIMGLIGLGAITYQKLQNKRFMFRLNLDWPTEITETELYDKFMQLPESKTNKFI